MVALKWGQDVVAIASLSHVPSKSKGPPFPASAALALTDW